MNPTDPNIGYTISLNLDDDDLLLVQNMNEDDDAAVTFLSSYQYVHFFAHTAFMSRLYISFKITQTNNLYFLYISISMIFSIAINMCKICTC